MKTKTISFRCPEEVLREMELLCEHNHMDRSGFIVQALQSMFSGLASQGVCQENKPLPSPAPGNEN